MGKSISEVKGYFFPGEKSGSVPQVNGLVSPALSPQKKYCQNGVILLGLLLEVTMAKTLTEERVPARMPTAVYDRLVEAAQAVGSTLNQFLVQAALEKANAVLEQERIVVLNATAAKTVFDLLESPPQPSERLKTAMKRRAGIECQK